MSHRFAIRGALLAALVTVLGCGGSSAQAPDSAAPGAPEPAYGAAESAPMAAGEAPSAADAAMEQEAPEAKRASQPADRPGLGTTWGESRESRITEGKFERAHPTQPFVKAALWYNDQQGANAMAGVSDYRAMGGAVVQSFNGGLTVSLQGEQRQTLPGFFANGKQYVIGEAGRRYDVVVSNYTGYRFEVVASVDGLDVIDGKPGSVSKRGYILGPRSTLRIDGFRQSSSAVAAFRFSSVRDSYSAKAGQGDRNVGVIGLAIFHERGVTPVWTGQEVERRHNADPFPTDRYAVPPRQ